ncbi:putative disease resistance protein [Spatholobus suberectus]|nr:putative disease resistance protein [Spatholobus suberectus]
MEHAMATTIIEGLVTISETYSLIVDLLCGFNSFNDNVQVLEMKLEELCSLEYDINKELEIAELQQGKKRKREVENWLRNVQRKKIEVYGIVQELKDGGVLRHLKLTVQVKKLTGQMTDLVERGRFPKGLVGCAQESGGYALLTTKLAGAMFQKNAGKIWDWLMNDGVLMIGVYGMGGVGKTSMLMHIHNLLLSRVTNFDSVFWVAISQSFSIHKLQCDVAKVVGLDISKEIDERKRAARLSWALMRRKRCVLFLDDVWNHFPLEKVGIPVKADGLKLVLTSRSLDVCRRMNCQNSVKVEPLSKEEAWTLFVGQPWTTYYSFSRSNKGCQVCCKRMCWFTPCSCYNGKEHEGSGRNLRVAACAGRTKKHRNKAGGNGNGGTPRVEI